MTIELTGVGKRYWKLDEPAMLLRSLLPFSRPSRAELWALRDIDFRVEQGEVVGVIGGNGAGKTTLLRLLAGVTRPTTGRVRVTGRVAPLISVGVGFHREMSGRENVYVNGMLLGLTKREIDQRLDAIVDFAEIDDFIDTPVKFYSSGMYMRLGFAVAVHTDPQVLLVDEVLAVGDIAFQMKSLDRMKEIRESGTTVILVSHSMQAIRLLCPRGVVVRRGQIVFDGGAEEAVAQHFHLLAEEHREDTGTAGVAIVERRLRDANGEVLGTIEPGATLEYDVRVRFHTRVESPVFAFSVQSESGVEVYTMQTPLQREYRAYEDGDEAEITMTIHARLLGGAYRLSAYVLAKDGRAVLASDPGEFFFVRQRHWTTGVADLDGSVAVDGHSFNEERSFLLAEGSRSRPLDD